MARARAGGGPVRVEQLQLIALGRRGLVGVVGRRGLQDWALFSLADELGLGDYAREQVAQVYGQFGGCSYDGCAPPISGFCWTTDTAAMDEIRANIADAIIEAQ